MSVIQCPTCRSVLWKTAKKDKLGWYPCVVIFPDAEARKCTDCVRKEELSTANDLRRQRNKVE